MRCWRRARGRRAEEAGQAGQLRRKCGDVGAQLDGRQSDHAVLVEAAQVKALRGTDLALSCGFTRCLHAKVVQVVRAVCSSALRRMT